VTVLARYSYETQDAGVFYKISICE